MFRQPCFPWARSRTFPQPDCALFSPFQPNRSTIRAVSSFASPKSTPHHRTPHPERRADPHLSSRAVDVQPKRWRTIYEEIVFRWMVVVVAVTRAGHSAEPLRRYVEERSEHCSVARETRCAFAGKWNV